MLGRSDGVDGAAELGFRECFFVTIHYGSHFVVGQRVEFVIGYSGGLGLVLVERHCDVAVFEILDFEGIGSVVDEHLGICADVDQMDYIVLHILVVTADLVVPSNGLAAARNALTSSPVHASE